MAELPVMDALREKRSELSGVVSRLEQQLAQHRGSLAHLDATMRLFDPDMLPRGADPAPQRERVSWFRPGECPRLICDVLRDAPQPLATRELAERVMAARGTQEAAWREDLRRVSNGEQADGVVGLAMRSPPSVGFCGYWQRAQAA